MVSLSIYSHTSETTPLVDRDEKGCRFRGMVYSFLSGFFYSLSCVVVKLFTDVDTPEIAFLNVVVQLVFNLPTLIFQYGNPFRSGHILLVTFRSVLFTGFLVTSFVSTRYLSLTESGVLVMSYTVWIFPLAKVFLKEKFGWSHLLALVTTLSGTVMTCLEADGTWIFRAGREYYFTGVGMAIVSAILLALSLVALKKADTVTQAELAVNCGIVGTVGCSVYTFLASKSVNQKMLTMSACEDQWVLIAGGLSFTLNQVFVSEALKMEEANMVCLIRTGSDLLFAVLWQKFWFHEMPSPFAWCGVALTALSSFIIYLGRKFS